LADVNSQQVSAATYAKIQGLLVNPRIAGPVHLASELAKLIFTEKEMAACTLTGRKINGQCRQMLNRNVYIRKQYQKDSQANEIVQANFAIFPTFCSPHKCRQARIIKVIYNSHSNKYYMFNIL